MTAPLIVIPPVSVTDAILISATATEADYPVWSGATTYALGARVIVTTGVHRIYESLAAGNIGNSPPASQAVWVEVGPTNRWAMFDTSNSTATAAPSGAMSYTLRPAGGINAVAALNVSGAIDIRVRLTHPTLGTIYDRTTDLATLPPDTGWWSWFFGTRTAPPLAVAVDLPGIPGCDLIVDFTGTSELAVGALVFGEQRAIGLGAQQGARVGIQDYSRKETNAYGDTVLVQRAFAKRASFNVPVLANQVDATVEFLTTLRALPCVWIGSAYASTVIFGFFKEFDVTIAYHSVSDCALQIEGMT